MYSLPKLPYGKQDLSPFLNEEQMTYHYDKHHQAYIDNLNKSIEGDSSLKEKSLEEIILSSSGPLFNNAAQTWNHTFYWLGIIPKNQKQDPSADLHHAINKSFGSLASLKEKFIEGGVKTFGSGWIWLCQDDKKQMQLISTSNAEVPFKGKELKPLLVADVWEHAYYVDYRNARAKYLEIFWDFINWKFVTDNYNSNGVKSLTQSMRK